MPKRLKETKITTKSTTKRALVLMVAFTAVAIGSLRAAGSHLSSTAGSPDIQQSVSPVILLEGESDFTLANGIVTAQIDKKSGDLISLKYKEMEMLGKDSGHPYGYWSHAPGTSLRVVRSITINPTGNGGQRAEVSIKGFYEGTPLGQGPGGSAVADIEVRYALGRGDSGLYTYSIFTHKPEYPATSIGEARFAAKLNTDIFDHMTVDANRNKKMAAPGDWDKGTPLNMKEARRLNTGIYAGQVEHKYDYSAIQFNIPAFGWSSTSRNVGLWLVNPSVEYLSGGATKVELTAHMAATVLNYWRGSHYGSSSCVIAQGEAWTKVIGPFMIYLNSGPNPDAMWKDALAKASQEAEAWPYNWVSGVDYPLKEQRGTVAGELSLNDPQAASPQLKNLLVGLSAPDYVPQSKDGLRSDFAPVDWQLDAKHYEFWVRADAQGRFRIPKVRPGNYTLHAIADGVLGEFTKTSLSVASGQTIDLGRLEWKPIRYGRQLWEIGIPNRSAEEFRHGSDYWHWGLYLLYPKEFPNDVNFIIGKSDYRKDWNYCQTPRIQQDDGTAKGPAAATTWSITFDLPHAMSGKAVLRMALAGNSVKPGIDVSVNDVSVGGTGPMQDTAVLRRDGIRGYWFEKDVTFDATAMKSGTNTLKLSIPAGGVMSGVLYDYLRLEVDEAAPAKGF